MTNWDYYLYTLRRGDFIKLCRMRFLNPGGSTAFTLDNDPMQKHSGAFIKTGNLSVNMQNGTRRTANVELANLDGEFDYNVNHVWFGQEIAIDMGLLLPNGTEMYIPQGIFLIDGASERVEHNGRIAAYSLTDKWAGLDGTLGGVLESTYAVAEGTNIFSPIASVLALDRGDGQPYDDVNPVFTEYYKNMTQTLPDGTTAALTDAPYQLLVDSDTGSVAEVILGLCAMVNAWVGYDRTGRLRVEPSQDDILDTDKPISWRFSLDEAQVTGLAYNIHIKDVINDYIVVGALASDYAQPAARAQNLDGASPTNINKIGRHTKRDPKPEFATAKICGDYAEWKVKRQTALQRAVTVSANQIFHLEENTLIEIIRTDKPGSPSEAHLIQGYTLPFSGSEPMTIQAVSVHDFPSITVTTN